jgi:prepilin-type N-terminal cleavage/methylation domain-containing protein
MSRQHISNQKGFSLIELLVVMVIVTIITGVSIFRFRDYNSSKIVEQTTYDLALLVRQAQTFGISSSDKDAIAGGSILTGEFESVLPTGIYFEYDAETKTYRSPVVLFRNGSDSDELVQYSLKEDIVLEEFTMPRGVYIEQICVNKCGEENSTTLKDDISVSFDRPEPMPQMVLMDASPSEFLYPLWVKISASSENSDSEYVIIETTGFIHTADI